MKLTFKCLLWRLGLVAVVAAGVNHTHSQDLLVRPARGGGLDTNAPMIHVDIFYDYSANQMHATLDTSQGTPKLVPLPAGYAFDSRSNYYVLTGKAYSLQYAWNPGGAFTPPAGAAVWIERLSASPGLENYDGPGNKNENPPRPYTPILGTAGSPTKWPWYGRMAHNAFAIRNPTTNVVSAEYRVYFGDAQDGTRENYTNYTDATVTLTWTADPVPEPTLFKFGASEQTQATPLCFLNSDQYGTESAFVANLRYTNAGPCALQFEGSIPMMAVAATATNGGPVLNHAALGACLELQFVSLEGPPQASLSFWEAGETQPRFSVPTGESAGIHCCRLSETGGAAGSDPYGCIQGRRFSVSQPGLYHLGFRIVDTSANGLDGGPIHAPSPLYGVYLQAGLTVASLARQGPSVRASFGSEPGKTFYLERTPRLGPSAQWQTVAGPLPGINRLQTFIDAEATGGQTFYRLRANAP